MLRDFTRSTVPLGEQPSLLTLLEALDPLSQDPLLLKIREEARHSVDFPGSLLFRLDHLPFKARYSFFEQFNLKYYNN